MRINLECQLQIIDGNKLEITSLDGRTTTSVPLDPLFIAESLPGAPEGPGPDLAAAGWSLIQVNISGQTVSKAYLISINQLQIVVDREETLSLSCHECFTREGLHPGFLSSYLHEKDSAFLKNFVQETLIFSSSMEPQQKKQCFQAIPEASSILYDIASFDTKEGHLVEAEEILLLLDNDKSRTELGELIFNAHIDKGNLAAAERIALGIDDFMIKSTMLGNILDAYLSKGDISNAARVNGKSEHKLWKVHDAHRIIEKCIFLEEFKKAKELALLMERESLRLRDQALIRLVQVYSGRGEFDTAQGLAWCIGSMSAQSAAFASIQEATKASADTVSSFSRLIEPLIKTSPDEQRKMKEAYFGLGAEKWREGIDGEHQKYGKEVYDKGLHGKDIEEGFIQSLEDAFVFVGKHLGEPTTPKFYLEVHRVVCSHFRGSETHTLMGQEQIGFFRNDTMPIAWHGLKGVYSMSSEAKRTLEGLNLGSISEECLSYKPMYDFQVKGLFTWFLQEYYEDILEAKTPREKLIAIARFTQRSQWLHPPKDGCGRTDTLILNKHLVENGFHPVILEHPYKSSTLPLMDWVAYLEEGIKLWEDFQEKRVQTAATAMEI